MKVKELMVSDVAACKPDANLAEVAKIMWDRDCGIVPVVDESRRVLGVVTDRDICIALATMNRNASDVPAGEVKSARVSTCGPEDDVETVLATLSRERIRRLPVVDGRGVLKGILSLNDLALEAEVPRDGRKVSPVSCKGILGVLKSVCGHRTQASARETARVAADAQC